MLNYHHRVYGTNVPPLIPKFRFQWSGLTKPEVDGKKKGPLAETETIGKWYFSQKKWDILWDLQLIVDS